MKYLLTVLTLLLSFNTSAFDHSHKAFNKILKAHVTFKGPQSLVNYKKIKEKDLKSLDLYLKELSAVKKTKYNSFTSDQKLAFLINAYNAFTIKLILNHYPVKSIKDIGSIFKSAWKKKFFTLLGKKMHLDEIEHGIIRKDFKEARIHFAVNCASIGCPPLLNEAFTAKNLETLLAKGEKVFLADKNKNKFDGKTLTLSKIFKWYGGDFDKIHGSLLNYLAPKMGKNPGDIQKIKAKKVKVKYSDYDWNLNESK